jgi:hypothetical protein
MNVRLAGTLLRIIVIALVAATFADIGRTLYGWLTGTPGANWALSGRWFLMVFDGHPFTPNIAAEPPLPFEYAVGYGAYYAVSLIFAAAYVILFEAILRRPAGLRNGLAFGLATIVFPLLVQMPAMGSGFFGLNTPMPLAIFGRTLVQHSCFGLGLGAGALLASRLVKNSGGGPIAGPAK